MSKPTSAEHRLNVLFEALRKSPGQNGVFNPWYQVDPQNDIGKEAPEIRRRHLRRYLQERLHQAQFLVVGEAIGYQGGHFSGIAMTSERILLGHLADRGVLPSHVVESMTPQRTSKPEVMPLGFTEPTATIVWQAIIDSGRAPRAFVLWNIFPWHPYRPQNGWLSNRTPGMAELRLGIPVIHCIVELFPHAGVLAVGRKSAQILAQLGIKATALRHPAQGGATEFRRQFAKCIV